METARIPKYCHHELLRLDHMTLPSKNFVSLWWPNEFMVSRQVKLRLVQCDDVTPGSAALHIQHSQQLLRQSHSLSFLRV
jgi:hypothetical protein